MPIYAYKCGSCGHAKDVLQKISDAPLTVCPVCGAASFAKQVTAAGFQLKGSGWYVTDFRGGSSKPPAAEGAAPNGEGAKNADAAKTPDGVAKPAESSAKPAEGAGSASPKSEPAKAPASGGGAD